MTGIVFDVKECAVRDGDGLRTTVFLKGCPLRCIWCHNPEGFEKNQTLALKHTLCTHCGLCRRGCAHEDCRHFDRCLHICPNGAVCLIGKPYEAQTLARQLMKNKAFYDATGGGVTFSGGEPLLQHEFLLETASYLSTNIAVETSGYADERVFCAVLEQIDCMIMDIKLADSRLHKRFTGVGNEIILHNAEILRLSGKKHIFRTPLIPHITDTNENLCAISAIVGDSAWEKIPYNTMAGAKYPMLGLPYAYDDFMKEDGL